MIYNTVFFKVCSILHCKNYVQLCIYDLFHIVLSVTNFRIHGMYMYVCMYVHSTYACSNVRMETKSNVGSVYNASKFVVPGLVL